jgi:hypothetical protein
MQTFSFDSGKKIVIGCKVPGFGSLFGSYRSLS